MIEKDLNEGLRNPIVDPKDESLEESENQLGVYRINKGKEDCNENETVNSKNNQAERSKEDEFTKSDLKRYEEVQTWLRTVSESTRSSYLNALKKLCNWCGRNPHELIMDRDKEKDISDPNKRNRTKNLILDFRKHLENEGYAPSSINAMDGAIRGLYSSILGKEGMINVGNYEHRDVTLKKDLVPTLEELKKLLDVSDLSTKFSIIFLAQTGMRPKDALDLKVGNIQRELDLDQSPLAVRFLPKKDRGRGIGERITFLGADGVKILKQYLEWRKSKGEEITPDSPLFVSRSKKYDGQKAKGLTKQMLNERIKEATKKAGIENGDNGKYGRFRTYCLRKFFMTQLTNHGMEDRIVDFLMCHKVSSVDLSYWQRRVDQLREEYRKREKFLNPISGAPSKPSSDEIEVLVEDKLKELMQSEEFRESCREALDEIRSDNNPRYESEIVKSEEGIIKYSNKGYNCEKIDDGKWLMKKEIGGDLS
ncbi:hypothetical protein AKJ45_00915 [candidate division MSBL1 archaeon SCGC-AAA261F19]|uniref:Tyr recombinase domain-containing protein n=2 Tax=candidate division MSBL1 TaxID=215777 RepID=A0A133VB41_9EURY|nr:hypothetical protein AKJ43_02835 [candidate division MSBL1 archaeon SCGC-AAA261D19]KXB03659.1 hypothetical protein AKJ45_00915 [candidate division MSBL1 archaeon SCGC-AAA261F19]